LGCVGFGSFEIMRQAMTTPMAARCSEVLRGVAHPERDKILASSLYFVGVPIDPAASEEDRRRHERLAKKYGLTLAERPAEKKTHRQDTGPRYYVRPTPQIFGGMEDLELEKAESVVKPYWWPMQKEEWDVDYWTAQGFNIFVVVDDPQNWQSKVPAYRSFNDQLRARCEQVAVLPTRRRLFGEAELKIYRLPDRDTRKQPPG
jgi:hypothetical protein